LRLFGKKCTLKKGKQRIHLWPDKEADAHNDSSTPSKIPGEEKDERGRLEKVRWLRHEQMLAVSDEAARR